jgi:hypothetical protein
MSVRFLRGMLLSGATLVVAAIVTSAGAFAEAAPGANLASSAWTPVDNFAGKVFAQADSNHDGWLSKSEFRAAQPELRSAMQGLVRRGALAGIPAAALNAQTSGPMLPGQQQISKPEFTLYARSLAMRMANHGAPFRAAALDAAGRGPRGYALETNGAERNNAARQTTGQHHGHHNGRHHHGGQIQRNIA